MVYVDLIESLCTQGLRYVGLTTTSGSVSRSIMQGGQSYLKILPWRLVTYIAF